MSGAQPGRMAAVVRSAASAPAAEMIRGRFTVDAGRPLAHDGGGLPAFAVIDAAGRAGLIAVQTPHGAPPRPMLLAGLPESDAALLPPLAHGPAPGQGGRPGWFVICPVPPGPPLWPDGEAAIRPWTEAELFALLLRPAAVALEALTARGITHRAIRPGNVFRASGTAAQAVLGCAWAAPPAMHQPVAFEAPYVAMCLPAGRGEGGPGDDVYALGATALALALGRMPWAGLSDDELIRRKLEHGSYAALAGEARLAPALADVLRAMLADDPAQRLPASMLADPDAARSRRVAQRPARRAQRPLAVGGLQAWDVRSLGFVLARHPAPGLRLLRDGSVDHWLRRALDDGMLAARLEEQTRRRLADHGAEDATADAELVLRAVKLLDPLAPLCWNGLAVWPDGIGPALAVHPEAAERLAGLVAAEAPGSLAAVHGAAEPHSAARAQARTQRMLLQRGGWAGGPARLRYTLNPLLPCRSAALGGAMVARLPELLAALEAAAPAGGPTLDAELVAFIAARQDHALEPLLAGFGDTASPLAPLRLLARLQSVSRVGPLPHLAAAMAAASRPALETWHSRTLRAEKQRLAADAAVGGDLSALLAVLDDVAARRTDAAAMRDAAEAAARIDATLIALEQGAAGRAGSARALGREIAGGLALAALAASGVAALLQ